MKDGAGSNTVSTFTPAQLAERTLRRRPVEAVIWGMPAVNAQLMMDALKQSGSDFNQIVYWSRPSGWKNQNAHSQCEHDLGLRFRRGQRLGHLFRFYGPQPAFSSKAGCSMMSRRSSDERIHPNPFLNGGET